MAMEPWFCVISMESVVGWGDGARIEEWLLSEFGVHVLIDGTSSGFLWVYDVKWRIK